MKTLENYIDVIGVMDHRKDAWKTSRPMFTEESLNFDKVADMDLSLNSMLVYTIEMRSSVIMRDLIFSLRPIEGWALSTRSMPITLDTVRLSSEFSHKHDDYQRILTMFDRLEAGESRDKVRDILPCTVSSTYTFTIDFRVLIAFCKAMEGMSEDIFHEYCIPLLKATNNLDIYKTSTVANSANYYLIHDNERINGIDEIGNMVVGHYKMKMALASQFLRQHYSKVKIGLWDMISDYKNIELSQADEVDVVFYTDKHSYHRLMSMRSHWVIDNSQDMWGKLTHDYTVNMSDKEFWDFIPAGGGKEDPYWADCYNRVLLEDPGVPCPIMTECREMIDMRRLETPDSYLLDRYEALFDAGFIEDNPNNEHRVLYFNKLREAS